MQNVTVMSTLAVEFALKQQILPSWTASGYGVDVQWNPTAVLMDRVRAGERADAIILIDESMDELTDAGIVVRETITPIAQAGFGLAVPEGVAIPDISTVEAFCDALLAARSIVYSLSGASGIYFRELAKQLGIDKAIESRAVTVPSGFTAEKLVTGEAEIAVQQVSELMSVPGIQIVGPFPPLLQKTTDFSIAAFADSTNPELAQNFIRHLSSEEAGRAYQNGGLTSRLPFSAKS